MTVASVLDSQDEAGEIKDLDGPSPLPVLPTGELDADGVAAAERAIGTGDAGGDVGERVAARMQLCDAWTRRGAIGPALEAARQAVALLPDAPELLLRLAELLERSGLHRESGEVLYRRAQGFTDPAEWQRAIHAYARAEATSELDEVTEQMLERAGESVQARLLAVDAARTVPGHVRLGERLVAASRAASAHGESDLATRCAVDAWVESRGLLATEFVAENLARRGDAAGALVVAVDGAARRLAAGRTDIGVLLGAAARYARSGGKLAAESAVLTVASMASTEVATLESLRDVLAECERTQALSARLRAEARRETDSSQATAAWMGVAMVERAELPARSAAALAEALAHSPDETEALALLRDLAQDPDVASAVGDAVFWATRSSLPVGPGRGALLMWLGDLERTRGDAASAALAYDRAWKLRETGALERIEQVTPRAEEQTAAAETALRRLESADRDERSDAVDALLQKTGATPGAARDLAFATRVLAPLVGVDDRVAAFWLRVIQRLGDETHRIAALRRISTRATLRPARVQAAVELAELLDHEADGRAEAIEVLQGILDEQSSSAEAATALVAMTGPTDNADSVRAAALVASRIETDAFAQTLLARLAGEAPDPAGPLRLPLLVLDDSPGLKERIEVIGELQTRMGASPALAARRTRALLALGSVAGDGLGAARSFASVAQRSPEATIAWFGAAGIAGQPEEVEAAAHAVVDSFAGARDVASVARAAIARLFALGEPSRAITLARHAAATIGLADRALRASVVEYALQQVDPAVVLELLEAAAAGTHETPGEHMSLLRRIAERHQSTGDVAGEAAALRRILVHAPADRDVLARLSDLLARLGDLRSLSRVLSLQLASQQNPGARRSAYLTLAALQAASGDRSAALVTIDQWAEEQPSLTNRVDAVRAMRGLGAADAAVLRLARWGEVEPDDDRAMTFFLAAARMLDRDGGDGGRVLGLARSGLVRQPEAPELLLFAEQVARQHRTVGAMLEIYGDLHEVAAGEHARQGLAYRRASYLEAVGEGTEALESFRALLFRNPASGALRSAVERLSTGLGRFDVLVEMHKHLAEGAATSEAQEKHWLEAARVAADFLQDRHIALELVLHAHDIRRAEAIAWRVVELAREMRPTDPTTARKAVETVVDRELEVADEVWDEERKREGAMRAAQITLAELEGDVARAVRAIEVFSKGCEDPPSHRAEVESVLDRHGASDETRAAVLALRVLGGPPAPPAKTAAQTVEELGATDGATALALAREKLGEGFDEALWSVAYRIVQEKGDPALELEWIDRKLSQGGGTAANKPLELRAAELLRGPLGRPADAIPRLDKALHDSPEDDELLRAMHDTAEQIGSWDVVAALLARRIRRASDRAETRALRLHRAAVLEQRMDELDLARAELEAILDDEPAHRAALRYLGDLHLRGDRGALAGECFARAAAATTAATEAADLLAAAGEAFTQAGDLEAAEAQFNRATQLDVRSARALRGLVANARARGYLGSLEATLRTRSDAQSDPFDRSALRLAAAEAALEAHAFDRAEGYLEEARAGLASDTVAEFQKRLEVARPAEAPELEMDAEPEAAIEGDPNDPRSPAHWFVAPPAVPQAIDPMAERTGSPPDGSATAIPLVAKRSAGPTFALAGSPAATPAERTEDAATLGLGDDILRAAARKGDAVAMASLAFRLARTERGREEALELERLRFNLHPSRLDALEAIVSLLDAMGHWRETAAVRSVLDAINGSTGPALTAPPIERVPELSAGASARAVLPDELRTTAEIGEIACDVLGESLRQDLHRLGIGAPDRVPQNATSAFSRLCLHAARVLQVPGTLVYVRSDVSGGVVIARTQPPGVIIGRDLAADVPGVPYVLGSALEATRASWLLAASLSADDRVTLVRALRAVGGAAPTGPAGRVHDQLVALLEPKDLRRLRDRIDALESAGTPFSDDRWTYAMNIARVRAGLLVSGDFAGAARMLVAQHRPGPGEPDLKRALDTLEPLRELARFAVSAAYLAPRWRAVP